LHDKGLPVVQYIDILQGIHERPLEHSANDTANTTHNINMNDHPTMMMQRSLTDILALEDFLKPLSSAR
jgi:hypothetical protein